MRPRLFTNVNGKLLEVGDIENLEKLQEFYLDFAKKKKYPDDFKAVEQSFENFKGSPDYQKLSAVEKDRLEKNPPKKVVVLKFDSLEDAKECLSEMEKKGILKPGVADKIVNSLRQEEEQSSSMRPRR